MLAPASSVRMHSIRELTSRIHGVSSITQLLLCVRRRRSRGAAPNPARWEPRPAPARPGPSRPAPPGPSRPDPATPLTTRSLACPRFSPMNILCHHQHFHGGCVRASPAHCFRKSSKTSHVRSLSASSAVGVLPENRLPPYTLPARAWPIAVGSCVCRNTKRCERQFQSKTI